MTIKVGTEYIHMALGYQDAQGAIVITEDTGLATMTGRYVDNLPTASTNPDAYTWTELADPEEADDTEDDTSEDVEDTSSMLYRMAGTQMTEAIQDNLAVGTNQGASGWETATGTIIAASCQPDGSAEAVNGVAWTATAGGTLLRTEHIPGEAMTETVTVSFWWMASAACGLTVSIGNNESETQYNHDSTDLDEDGNALDLTDAWLFFRALIPIAQTADDYAVKVATDSAATISICDFKVEPGDKVTAWTESAKAAMAAAQTADSKAQQADSKAQAAGDKATAADEKAQTANATAQAAQTALNGLTKVQDGQVLIDGDKVYLSAAFVRSIFAKDITATGTITGAQLIGAILSGESIHIVSERVYDDTDEDGLLYQRVYNQTVIQTVQDENGVDYLILKQASVTDDYNDDPPVAANTPYRTDVNYGDGSYIKLANEGIFVHTPYILDVNGGTDTYTSFSGGVLSAGSLTVTKKLGMCWISGTVTLSKSITDWTTILSSAKVPAPQHGELVPFTVSQWGSSYIQPLRGKITPNGGLQIRGGAAKEYVFTLSYPID